MHDDNLLEDAQEVLERLTAWRASRRGGEAIPEELWQMAAQLGYEHGLYATSRLLHMHYGDLKRRVLALNRSGARRMQSGGASRKPLKSELAVRQQPGSTAFIEWLPTSAPLPTIAAVTLQVDSRRGSMRIEMQQVPADAMAAIMRGFAE